MMRILFYCSLFFFAPGFLHAQDTLYKSDGSKQNVKIIGINQTQLRYKSNEDPGGQTFVISKEDLIKVVYQTGTTEVFSQKAPEKDSTKVYKTEQGRTAFYRNSICFTPTDLLFDALTLSYEFTLKSGDFSLRFPISIGLTSGSSVDSNGFSYVEGDYYNRYKTFSTGIDFYFYSAGQGKAKFYFGPSLEYGQFNYWSYNYNVNPPYDYWYSKEKGSYYAVLLQNGIAFQPGRNFSISVNAGIGFSQRMFGFSDLNNYSNSHRQSQLVIRGGINIGYKF